MMVVMIEIYNKGTRIKTVYYMETDFCYCSFSANIVYNNCPYEICSDIRICGKMGLILKNSHTNHYDQF